MDESESLIISGELEIGDEFYEKIEAPKFVDLTEPDPFQPGEDRLWFCLRAGCDQNHDEEMDSETIYKNFVLRVMAARSPNVCLRKALCRKQSGLDVKYPRTVPAKPSKSRVTRMALISSISKSIVDTKVKVKPLSENATQEDKAKRGFVTAKALTTPRSKKQLENPKTTGNSDSNGTVVAKALVFDSPQKAARTKISKDSNAPLKKVEITDRKKQALGYNRPLPSDNTRKKNRTREVKSRVFEGLNYHKHAKSSKCLEKSKKENTLRQNYDQNHVEALTDASRIDSKPVLSFKGRSFVNDDNVSQFQPLKEISKRDDKEPTLNSDNNGNGSEEIENDDKENAFASNRNRKLDVKTSHIKHEIFGKHKNLKNNQETTTAKCKQLKESSTLAPNGSQCLKLKKPKSTNPKPFRLRTDERGILKEANSEKQQNASQRDAKYQERTNSNPKSLSSRQLSRLKEEASNGNETAMVKTCKLGTIKETSRTVSRATETSKQRQNGASMAIKGSASSGPKTVPKEPNFRSIHVPKSYTRRVLSGLSC